jgi:hypothetical protein
MSNLRLIDNQKKVKKTEVKKSWYRDWKSFILNRFSQI